MPGSCLDYAMNYIYRFPKTEKELEIQLLKKGYAKEDIEKTINYLKEETYLDDRKFVNLYLNSEVVRKWKPIFVVKWKLLSKWVDKEMLEEIIDSMEEDIEWGIMNKIEQESKKLKAKWLDWITIIRKLLSKWYKLDAIKKYVEIWQKNKID